jgi:hypothetical protein
MVGSLGRVGLVVLGVLSLADVAAPLLTDGEHPPMAVAIVASVLGVLSIAFVVLAWGGRRWPIIPLIVLRALSALAAVPAFLADGVPGPAKVASAVLIALTAIGIALIVADRPRLEVA